MAQPRAEVFAFIGARRKVEEIMSGIKHKVPDVLRVVPPLLHHLQGGEHSVQDTRQLGALRLDADGGDATLLKVSDETLLYSIDRIAFNIIQLLLSNDDQLADDDLAA